MDVRFTHKRVLWENRRNVLKGTLCLVVVDFLVLALPLLVKVCIDFLQNQPLPKWIPDFYQKLPVLGFIISVCFIYLAMNAMIAFIRYWWRVHLVWSTFAIFHHWRRYVFDHIMHLDREFYRNRKVGDLLSALTSDTENVRMTMSIGVLMIIDAAINFVLFPILLWRLNSQLTLMVMLPLVVISFLALILSDRLAKYYEQVQEITANLSGRAFEIMSGIRVIKAFRNEKPIHDEFIEESKKLRDSSLKIACFQGLFAPGLEFALGIALCIVLVWGGLQVIHHGMPLSNLVAFQLYLANMDWPMMAIGWFIQMYRLSQASQERVQNIIEHKNPLFVQKALMRGDGSLLFELKNIRFSFGKNRKFLLGPLDLVLTKPGFIGLTGPVGAGKTTLLELLSRQRDPISGEILFRGINLKEFSSEEIAKKILYVPQEAFLFSRTLRTNLGLGIEQNLDDEFLSSILTDLNFKREDLEKRGGLSIRLGERGLNLSGGQRQRIALGRALARQREVYLFDDVFSHIDAETEAKIIQRLRMRIPSSALVVLVSQRIETLNLCDEILILGKNGIEAKGRPEELPGKSQFFDDLKRIQNQERDAYLYA